MKAAILLFASVIATAAPIVTTQQQCSYFDGPCSGGHWTSATVSLSVTETLFSVIEDAEASADINSGAQISGSYVSVFDTFYGAGPVRPGFIVVSGYLDADSDATGSAGASLAIG